jgi:hypothetical protein
MFLSHMIYTVRPFLIHTCHAMPMPRPYHALTMPFFSRPRHSTAIERRPVDYLPAFGFFQPPRGVPRRLLSEAYQSSSQRSIPTTGRASRALATSVAQLFSCPDREHCFIRERSLATFLLWQQKSCNLLQPDPCLRQHKCF